MIAVVKHIKGVISEETDIFVILDYMPPFPGPDTVAQKVVVWCPSADAFLRDCGTEAIWDIYGDDLGTVTRAMELIKIAPAPRKPYLEIQIPAKKPKSHVSKTPVAADGPFPIPDCCQLR